MKSDILIIGAGMVGTAQAIALAQAGLRVALIERNNRERAFDTRFDGRASAIARSSQYVFEHIGVWEAMRAQAEPINDIRVVDAYSHAVVHYDHREADGQPFGHIIPNTHILPTLLAAAEKQEGLDLLFDTELEGIETDTGGVTATLSGGRTCRASLLLAADGRFSKTRDMLGLKAKVITYGQSAMVSVIKHSKPHHGVALERFMPSGPFAILPMQGNRSGVVWSEPDEVAAMMMKLTDAEYAAEIHRRAGEYLGDITMEGKRFSYPLGIVLTRHTIAPRAALIGDAAHAMHPIAGQGVNVGYRDVAALTELLVEAKQLGLDCGAASVLERYERRRRVDVMSMLAATDGINRLFSNNSLPLKLARRIGLSAVERAPKLKGYFMFRAMGLTGDLPPMLKRDVA